MSGRNKVVGCFSESSRGIELHNGHKLKAECKDERGNWCHTELDLNSCIGNLNGYLSWDYIEFSNSACDIKLAEGGTKLEARLRKQDGEWGAPQGIWLNERVKNRNGRLVFVPHTEAH